MSKYKTAVIAASLILTRLSYSQSPQISSYDIRVKFEKDTNRLVIQSSLEVKSSPLTDTLNLLFSTKAKLESVSTKANGKQVILSAVSSGLDTISVPVAGIENKDSFTLLFDYTYPLDEKDTLVILDRGNRWYPLIAENVAKAKLVIDVPKNYNAIAAGNLIRKELFPSNVQFEYESAHPIFKLPLVIAPQGYYNEYSKSCDDKKILVYTLSPKDSSLIEKLNFKACDAINYFDNKIGKYEFNLFTILEVRSFQGMNIGSSIIMTDPENLIYFERGYDDWINYSTAMQWFGAGAFPKLFSKGFWFFSISLPHYLKLMYIKEVEGDVSFNKQLNNSYNSYKEIAGTEKDVPILQVDMPNTSEKGRVLYGKGVYVLDKIRLEMGDENWLSFLKDFYTAFCGKVFVYENFMEYLHKYDADSKCVENLEKMLSGKGLVD